MKLPYRIDAPTEVVESRHYKEADTAIIISIFVYLKILYFLDL